MQSYRTRACKRLRSCTNRLGGLAVTTLPGASRSFNAALSTGLSLQVLKILLLQPLRWCCVDCVIHDERDVREEQKYMDVARTSNNRVISSGDLYCCLLPQCAALRTSRSGFPIATKWCCDQNVKVVRSSAFTQRTCDQCGSL